MCRWPIFLITILIALLLTFPVLALGQDGPEDHSWLIAYCDFPDVDTITSTKPISWYTEYAIPSLNAYYKAVTYGRWTLTNTRIITDSRFTVTYPYTAYFDNNGRLRQTDLDIDCFKSIEDQEDISLYDGLIMVFNKTLHYDWGRPLSGSYDGVTRTWGLVMIAPPLENLYAMAHEIGHGYNAWHPHIFYDSPWDVVSGGYRVNELGQWIPTHPIAYHKRVMGMMTHTLMITNVNVLTTTRIERLANPLTRDYLEISVKISPTLEYSIEVRDSSSDEYEFGLPTTDGPVALIHRIENLRNQWKPFVLPLGRLRGDDLGRMWSPGEALWTEYFGVRFEESDESGIYVTIVPTQDHGLNYDGWAIYDLQGLEVISTTEMGNYDPIEIDKSLFALPISEEGGALAPPSPPSTEGRSSVNKEGVRQDKELPCFFNLIPT